MKSLVSKLGLGRSRDKSKDQQRQRQSSSPVVLPTTPSNNATTTTQQQHVKTPLLSNATSDSTAASEADTVSIEVTPTIIPLSRSGAPQLKKLGSNTQRQHGGGGILHQTQPHAHNNINNSHIQSNNIINNSNSNNGSITTSRVRFAPTSNKYSSQSSITSNTTSQSSHQVHLMALGGSQTGSSGASVASASVVSKDSIFDRVLREENERLKTMGMGERDSFCDPYCLVKGAAGGGKGVSGGGSKRDGMRGGRRVEI
jgi:hypothetical protein